MTSNRKRKSVRVSRPRSNVIGMNFIRDYRKLGVELLRKPMTRYILGGVALTVAVPYILRMMRNEEVVTFVRDNVDNIRTRIDGYIHTADSDMDSLNQ